MGQTAIVLSAKIEELKAIEDRTTSSGIPFPRYFTSKLEAGKTPYDEVQWETRTASIGMIKALLSSSNAMSKCRWIGPRQPPISLQQVFLRQSRVARA